MQVLKTEAMLSIVLIYSNHLLEAGLNRLLNRLNMNIDFIHHQSDSFSLPEVFSEYKPDIIMIDTHKQKDSLNHDLRAFTSRFPSAKVIIYSVAEEREHILKAFKNGAAGYLSKRTEVAMLREAIRAVNDGHIYICPWFATTLLDELKHLNQRFHYTSHFSVASAAPPADLLTKRELDFIPLVAKGMSNKRIGKTLGITEKAVKNHISKILTKLELRDRTQIALKAIKNGWVSL